MKQPGARNSMLYRVSKGEARLSVVKASISSKEAEEQTTQKTSFFEDANIGNVMRFSEESTVSLSDDVQASEVGALAGIAKKMGMSRRIKDVRRQLTSPQHHGHRLQQRVRQIHMSVVSLSFDDPEAEARFHKFFHEHSRSAVVPVMVTLLIWGAERVVCLIYFESACADIVVTGRLFFLKYRRRRH